MCVSVCVCWALFSGLIHVFCSHSHSHSALLRKRKWKLPNTHSHSHSRPFRLCHVLVDAGLAVLDGLSLSRLSIEPLLLNGPLLNVQVCKHPSSASGGAFWAISTSRALPKRTITFNRAKKWRSLVSRLLFVALVGVHGI